MIEIAAKNPPSITLFDWPYSNMVITGAMTNRVGKFTGHRYAPMKRGLVLLLV